MSTHETGQLGAYCLGALAIADTAEVEAHLVSCPDCRRELAELDAAKRQIQLVPPEVLLDGAAEDSDLLLARILRAAEQPAAKPAAPRKRRPWYRGPLAAAAGVVVLAGVFAGGIVAGHQGTPPSATALPSGTRTVSATDPVTGVGMSMQLIPGRGWVTLAGRFTGVTPGTPCEIYVVSTAGQRVLAGGWVAPADANTAMVTVTGSAIMDPGTIGSVEIDTTAGGRLVTAVV